MMSMRHEFFFQRDRGIVEIHASGKATVEGFSKLDTELLEHPSWTPGMRVVFDLRELELKTLSAQDTRASSDFVRARSDRFGRARFAIVMGSDVDFGIARMFEILTSDGTELDIMVFRSMSEAQSWVKS